MGKRSDKSDFPPVSGPGFQKRPRRSDEVPKIKGYRVLEELGQGGMGIVYLAEQDKPVKRRVALKVIKPGMDSKHVLARFEAEEQALALLDHPNVARVYEAGATEAERPYFAMEYVKGVPITEHCDREKLSIEERLELFLRVCDGIHHAHQKGIIHRDIKPSNILVSIEAEQVIPKIIDFGVAKAVSQPLTERTLFTEQGQLVGTPEYMSPEQARMTAEDVDIRTDVYSLGVLLYEMLTGALPFDPKTLRQAAFDEILRIIREQDPPRPSARLTSLGKGAEKVAQSRRTRLAVLAKRLHKELEWIPLKAMRKERTHRYRSASELADDVQNYLNGAPLIAGPESATYRLKKFVRRNRALVTGVAAVLLVLVAGIVVSTIFAIGQARARAQAERQAKISRAVNEFLNDDLLGSLDTSMLARTREITVRSLLDAASKNVEGRFENEPLIEAAIRNTLGNTYKILRAYKSAEFHLERALEIRREQLGNEHPDTHRSVQVLVWVYLGHGPDRYKDAEKLCVKELEFSRHVFGEEHLRTIDTMADIALVYSRQGRYKEAESLFLKALELRKRLEGEIPVEFVLQDLANIYHAQGRYEEAEQLYLKQIETVRSKLGEEHTDVISMMQGLAQIYTRQGRYEEAEKMYLKALEIRRRSPGEDHPYTADSMEALGYFYHKRNRYEEAERLFVRALDIYRHVLGEEHPDTVDVIHTLVGLYAAWGKPEQAEQWRAKLPRKEDVQEQ